MNYKWIALIIIALAFLFQTYMEWLEMKSADLPTPDNVKDIYDAGAYGKWLQYHKEKTRLSLMRHLVSYLFTFLLIGGNIYAFIIKGLSLSGDYAAAVGVLAADTLICLLYVIPFEYVDSMVIEQKYGFNRMTKKTFVTDQIKSVLIDLTLTCGLCCLFILIHKALGNWLLVVFSAVMFGVILLVSFLFPIFSKIFNHFDPLPEGELRERLCRLLEKNNCTVKEIKVMDGSKRSSKANAYFTGFGKMKTIVLYDTLLEQMSTDEIVAVFAHEMGHNKHKDTLKMQFINIVNIVVMVLSLWALVSVPEIYPDFGFAGLNYGFAFLLLFSVCLAVLSPLVGIFTGAVSRRMEYQADRFAAQNGHGQALISALKVLSRNSFICLSPHPILVTLTYDHPTVSQRIEALEKWKQ
ncbi:MAG: M48 family metallopeptidase [Clostridium sp.]|nr:M48 family metallopeptidase [Clostridium sp.]